MFRVIENATVHEFAFSTLSFLKINNERIGKYTCKAQNTIGTAEVTAIGKYSFHGHTKCIRLKLSRLDT